MLKEVDRIGGLRVAGRATVGAPPADAGGPYGPAGSAAKISEDRMPTPRKCENCHGPKKRKKV